MTPSKKNQILLLTLLFLCVAHLGVAQTPTPSSVWDVSGSGDATIQGFAAQFSVNLGETVNFKISSTASAYKLDIYRVGYYGGNGAALITSINPSVSLPQTQPACKTDASTHLYDCGNWATSASWAVPLNAKSGVYFAKAIRSDTKGASHIFFVVRDDSSHADIVFQTSDTTWQAYNSAGGYSFYGTTGSNQFNSSLRAYKVSYNRPITTRAYDRWDYFFNGDYPMIRWLEANGYNVTYVSGNDVDQRGSLLLNHKMYLSISHDEYWSGPQRKNVEAARDAGVNLAFFGGSTPWKTRWENSIDGSNTPNRTLVCYKESDADAKIDPNPAWTGLWRDMRFAAPSEGVQPENALIGMENEVLGLNPGNTITVPDTDGKMRFWRNTNIATLASGASSQISSQILSFEWDEDRDNGYRPAGQFWLSTSPYTVPSYLYDYLADAVLPGVATHHLALHRAASGALVFGAGTNVFPWAFDANHDDAAGSPPPVDLRIQQAAVNLFADMGVQPTTLQAGLVAATKSTDTLAPTSTINSPVSGASITSGTVVTISGSATDTGGGVVGGVEVSVDNGVTWHPATGRSSWSYSWVSNGTPTTILSRAVDDSGNLESSPRSVTVNSSGAGTSSQLLGYYSSIGFETDIGDSNAITGSKFVMPNVSGTATAMSVYVASPIQSSSNNQYSMAIYADAGGSPGALVASTANSTLTGNAWNTIPISATLTPNTVYWLVYNTNATSLSNNNMKYSIGSANQSIWRVQNFGTWPSTFGSGGGTGVGQYNIFVLYNVTSQIDKTLPTAPTNLNVTGGAGTASLTWTAATDNVGVTLYNVYRSTTNGFTPSTANRIGQPTGTSYTDSNLAAGTYYYLVTAQDAAGNVGPQSNPASASVTAAPDTQAPTAPTNVAAVVSSGTISLSWTAATDNFGVVQYNVYRSTVSGFTPSAATLVGQPTVTGYSDTGLAIGTYYYKVTAQDAVPNVGPASNQATAVIPDNIPPGNPSNLSATGGAGTASLTWTAATDNVAVTLYNVYRSTTSGFAPSTANRVGQPTGTSFNNTGLTAGTYYYLVAAQDAAGNIGASSNQAAAIVTAPTDTQAPTAPTSPKATVTSGTVALTWTAATDNVGVVLYNVYRSTTTGFTPSTANRVGQPTSTAYTDTGLAIGTYYYKITAQDAAGNVGTASSQVTGKVTVGVDNTPPTVPTNLLATPAASSIINLSWGVSTDSGSGMSGYRIYRGVAANSLSQVGTTTTATTYSDTGLTANTTYYYAVAAVDVSGNVSNQAGPVSATTLVQSATFQFGTPTVGTISDTGYANTMSAFKYQTGATQNGPVSSMTVYIPAPISASPNNLFQVAIYSDSNGAPGSLIASSASMTIAAAGWNTVPVTTTLTANTAYWLVYNTNGSGSVNNSLILSVGGTYSWRAQTFGTWPATFGATQGSASNTASIYATVN